MPGLRVAKYPAWPCITLSPLLPPLPGSSGLQCHPGTCQPQAASVAAAGCQAGLSIQPVRREDGSKLRDSSPLAWRLGLDLLPLPPVEAVHQCSWHWRDSLHVWLQPERAWAPPLHWPAELSSFHPVSLSPRSCTCSVPNPQWFPPELSTLIGVDALPSRGISAVVMKIFTGLRVMLCTPIAPSSEEPRKHS